MKNQEFLLPERPMDDCSTIPSVAPAGSGGEPRSQGCGSSPKFAEGLKSKGSGVDAENPSNEEAIRKGPSVPRNTFVIPQTVRCAVQGCEAVRRENNHWHVIAVINGCFYSRPYVPMMDIAEGDYPACGDEHAMKLYQKFS